jgi:uncharacterized membrane protein YbaN (DUF454 family)
VTQGVHHPLATRKPRSRVLRAIYLVLGLFCLVFVALSWLPGIPTFDFVILAAFFFSMSSDRLHGWMVNHPVYGKMIRSYRSGGLTPRAKWTAAIAITISLSVSALILTDNTILRIILGAVGLFALWFVFSRPTRSSSSADQPPLTA